MLKIRTSCSAHAAAVMIGTVLAAGGQALADQVIPDDLIVQGSLCVGFDCVNGESFGFDTIRMKENNTRINFMDTSASPFPTRDWQLVANASASGGLSYFGIRDCGDTSSGASECGTRVFAAEAGAGAESIYIDSTSRVGFRTATPVLDLHVRTGNTPGQRLEQDGSSGFTPQTWDIAGNEANFFVRDVTGGSRLPFRIRPGAPTSSIDIAGSGNVGMGTTSPAAPLHISNAGAEMVRIQDNDSSGIDANPFLAFFDSAGTRLGWVGDGSGSTDRMHVNSDSGDVLIRTNATPAGIFLQNAGNVGIGTTAPAARLHTVGTVRLAGVANCSSGIQSDAQGDLSCITSSRRFKHVEAELTPDLALANVMALRPQVGFYKATPEEPEHWLIAEDVAAVDRALVGLREGEPYTVKTQNVVADLVAVIQEQQRRIQALERVIGR